MTSTSDLFHSDARLSGIRYVPNSILEHYSDEELLRMWSGTTNEMLIKMITEPNRQSEGVNHQRRRVAFLRGLISK